MSQKNGVYSAASLECSKILCLGQMLNLSRFMLAEDWVVWIPEAFRPRPGDNQIETFWAQPNLGIHKTVGGTTYFIPSSEEIKPTFKDNMFGNTIQVMIKDKNDEKRLLFSDTWL